MEIRIEKEQCYKDYENHKLVMSDEKCGECEFLYTCRFMKSVMDEVVYGSD